MKAKRIAKRGNFVSPNEKAKSVVAQLVRIARKARLGYDDFLYISQQARAKDRYILFPARPPGPWSSYRLPSGNGKRLFRVGQLQGCWALRFYENCAGQLVQRSPTTR